MLTPLILPADASPAAHALAAEYVLGLTDVAALFGVHRVTAHEWTRTGRRAPGASEPTPLPHLQPPTGRRLEPIRFRYPAVVEWGQAQQLPLRLDALDPLVQATLGLPVTTSEAWVNESEAARVLGIGRSLLWKRRHLGHLNEGVVTRAAWPQGTEYLLSCLQKVTAGKLALWAEPGGKATAPSDTGGGES